MSTVDYKKELDELIEIIVSENGSDIHLAVGSHPILRVGGSLISLMKMPVLTHTDVLGFVHVLLTKEQ